MHLPHTVQTKQDQFATYYLNKHAQRKLEWQNWLATAELVASFDSGRKLLDLAAVQACVLITFNEELKQSFADIQRRSGITDSDALKRVLHSLVVDSKQCPPLLLKKPISHVVSDTDLFLVNKKKFSHKLFRVKVNPVQSARTTQERKSTAARVLLDRQYSLDAHIVRIMKARKTMQHSQLTAEILEQIKFPTEIKDIKKRIETLIEREYMERDAKDSKIYHYMA